MSKQKLHTAEEYALQVMSGEVLVCEYVRLAVERYYNDLDVALDRGWYFDRKAHELAHQQLARHYLLGILLGCM